MELFRERPYRLWAAMLGASLILAIGFYFLFPQKQTERVLFFPENITGDLKGESRLVPRVNDLEGQVRAVVGELLLGPERLRDQRITSPDTVLDMVVVRKDTAYIDFSPEMVISQNQPTVSARTALGIVERTIRFNFPAIRKVVLTIGGQLPGKPYFSVQ